MFNLRNLPVKRMQRIGLVLVFAVLLAGCTSGSLLAGSSWPGVTLDGDAAYVAYNSALYAIDTDNGRENWRFPLESERSLTFFAAPTVTSDGLLVAGSYANTLYALQDLGGQADSEWTFTEAGDRYIGSPVIVDDLVLAPNADGNLYALDLLSGDLVWTYAASEGNALWSAPLIVDDYAYLTSLDHELYCIDIRDGSECWKQDLGGAIASTPALYNDVLLTGTFGSELLAVAIEDGAPLWSIDAQGWIWGTPTVVGSRAFFGDLSGTLYAIDLENEGAELWTQPLDGAVTAAVAADEDNVYAFTDSGSVYAFEQASGVPVWPRTVTIEGKLNADAVLRDGSLYIPTTGNDCLLFAVDTDAGSLRCEFQPE